MQGFSVFPTADSAVYFQRDCKSCDRREMVSKEMDGSEMYVKHANESLGPGLRGYTRKCQVGF